MDSKFYCNFTRYIHQLRFSFPYLLANFYVCPFFRCSFTFYCLHTYWFDFFYRKLFVAFFQFIWSDGKKYLRSILIRQFRFSLFTDKKTEEWRRFCLSKEKRSDWEERKSVEEYKYIHMKGNESNLNEQMKNWIDHIAECKKVVELNKVEFKMMNYTIKLS